MTRPIASVQPVRAAQRRSIHVRWVRDKDAEDESRFVGGPGSGRGNRYSQPCTLLNGPASYSSGYYPYGVSTAALAAGDNQDLDGTWATSYVILLSLATAGRMVQRRWIP